MPHTKSGKKIKCHSSKVTKIPYDYCADYVIVGTGSAGAVIANVLSSDHSVSVLALEAGDNVNNDAYLNNPANAHSFGAVQYVQYEWQGSTLPDPDAADQVFQWTNGRVLGGGSSINTLLYMRGTTQLFDQDWAPIAGPEWDADHVYAAYKDMEKFFGPTTHPETHGYNGEMAIRVGVPDTKAATDFISSVRATINPPLIDDYNNPGTQIGVFPNWQYFEFPDGSRASSSRTYLNSTVMDNNGVGVGGRKLIVLTRTTATQIIWSQTSLEDGNTPRVRGVIAIRDGKPIRIKAAKQLIVSAGFNSSAFLQVNGVGPASVLQAAGVPVIVNSPSVGTNMYDYPYVLLELLCPPGVLPNSDPATLNAAGALLPDPRPGKDPQRLDFKFQPLVLAVDGLNIMIITIEAPLLPKSRGTIQIQNPDPLKIASVQLGLLNDPDDLAMIIACANYVAPVIQSLADKGYVPLSPTVAQLQDPVFMTNFIQTTVGNSHHYQAFNKMAPQEQGGVVDSWGHVYGAEKLMVVDDSIAPTGTDGNPNATAEMLAFRIGHRLLEDN